MVNHPGEIATRSQRSVARAAKLSAPTFSRLARAVGYDNYDELRESCRADVLNNGHLLANRAQTLVDEADSEVSFAARHVAASLQNIETLIAEISTEALADAAQVLANARRVAMIGMLSARPVADYAVYIANMALGGWSSIARCQTGLAIELADLGPQDAAVVLSIEPYSAQAVTLTKHVTAKGVPLIALADTPFAPVAENAKLSFSIRTESPQFFPSHVAATVIFEALIGMVIQKKGPEAQKRIAAVERQNHELGEYWQDKPAKSLGD